MPKEVNFEELETHTPYQVRVYHGLNGKLDTPENFSGIYLGFRIENGIKVAQFNKRDFNQPENKREITLKEVIFTTSDGNRGDAVYVSNGHYKNAFWELTKDGKTLLPDPAAEEWAAAYNDGGKKSKKNRKSKKKKSKKRKTIRKKR